jgi:hypothetical protein
MPRTDPPPCAAAFGAGFYLELFKAEISCDKLTGGGAGMVRQVGRHFRDALAGLVCTLNENQIARLDVVIRKAVAASQAREVGRRRVGG